MLINHYGNIMIYDLAIAINLDTKTWLMITVVINYLRHVRVPNARLSVCAAEIERNLVLAGILSRDMLKSRFRTPVGSLRATTAQNNLDWHQNEHLIHG